MNSAGRLPRHHSFVSIYSSVSTRHRKDQCSSTISSLLSCLFVWALVVNVIDNIHIFLPNSLPADGAPLMLVELTANPAFVSNIASLQAE